MACATYRDFNGDGKADLAVANWGDNTVTVLLAQVTETATAAISASRFRERATHNVDASYAGDSNFGASTSSTIPLTGTASQTTPMITWATPAAITYGTALSATQLDANSGGRGGRVRLQPAGRKHSGNGHGTRSRHLHAERHDGLHDRNADGFVDGEQATPLITWATPAAITYGTALSATQLDASSGGVAGASSTTRWQEALRQRARTHSRSPSRRATRRLHDRNADGFVDGEQGHTANHLGDACGDYVRHGALGYAT